MQFASAIWPFIVLFQKIFYFQGGFLLARLVKYLTENFASEEKAQEVEKFFKENEFPGTERTVSQSVETIRLNAAWLQRDLPNITDYLSTSSN